MVPFDGKMWYMLPYIAYMDPMGLPPNMVPFPKKKTVPLFQPRHLQNDHHIFEAVHARGLTTAMMAMREGVCLPSAWI